MLQLKPTTYQDISTIIQWENDPLNKEFIFQHSEKEHQDVIKT